VNRLSTDRGNWSTKTAKGPAISPTIGNAERTKARTLVMRLAPRTGFHPPIAANRSENHFGFLARCTGQFPQLAHAPSRVTVDMRLTCTHAYHMSKMVQIRNVPEALHRKLKVRAADAGRTLSDYLLAELERLAARPTRDEMLTRLHGRKRITLKTPAAVVVREERESA